MNFFAKSFVLKSISTRCPLVHFIWACSGHHWRILWNTRALIHTLFKCILVTSVCWWLHAQKYCLHNWDVPSIVSTIIRNWFWLSFNTWTMGTRLNSLQGSLLPYIPYRKYSNIYEVSSIGPILCTRQFLLTWFSKNDSPISTWVSAGALTPKQELSKETGFLYLCRICSQCFSLHFKLLSNTDGSWVWKLRG